MTQWLGMKSDKVDFPPISFPNSSRFISSPALPQNPFRPPAFISAFSPQAMFMVSPHFRANSTQMKPILKRRKGVDRISNLPNNLITHILSFLQTKDAVRTSVFSTQWIHQWASITHLDFDDGFPMRNGTRYDTPTIQSSFVLFVYRVLLFKVTRLDLFRLKCGGDYDGVVHVSSWLSAALSRHVREIDVTVPKYLLSLPPLPWPRLELNCLFSSTTLVVLKLGRGFVLRVPDIVSLESLKILHLSSVEFEDSVSLTRLVSSCPVLEEFEMDGELNGNIDELNISSLVLKRLIINRLYAESHPYEVVLNTPSLEYLEHYDDGVPEGYHLEMETETLHCLDRARLCLFLHEDQFEQYDELVLAKSMADLALAISNVRFLYLSDFAFKAFYHPGCVLPNFELPKFPRLTSLDIGGITVEAGLSLLIAFLEGSPQLTALSFGLELDLLDEVWDPPNVVPFCMQHNLKVIEVNFFCGRPLELKMVKYFLGKTISLEELVLPQVKEEISMSELVNPNRKVKTEAEVIDEVLMLPKASKSCKIVIT